MTGIAERILGPLAAVVVIGAVALTCLWYFNAFSIAGPFLDSSRAVRALEVNGHSNVQVTDRDVFWIGFGGCSDRDSAKFELTSTNPVGKEVETEVCMGFWKGATMRVE